MATGTIDRNCNWCGKPYKARRDYLNKGAGLCCSKSCGSYLSRSATKKVINCLYCQKPFNPRTHKVTCCSHDCSNKHYKQNLNPDRESVIAKKKMSQFCCGVVKRCFKSKTGKLSVMLGYAPADLVTHLEGLFKDGMNWGNYGMKGDKVWNVDHIRPISSFPFDTDISIINALSNLQPLWATENFTKNAKY